MKKKWFLVPVIPIIIIIAIYLYFSTITVDKMYTGYYVNMQTKEVVGKCNVILQGKYKEHSEKENGKYIGVFNGSIIIDNNKYDLNGNTVLNENNEYYMDDDGGKLLTLNATDDGVAAYRMNMHDNFNDKYISIYDNYYGNISDIEIVVSSEEVSEEDILNNM